MKTRTIRQTIVIHASAHDVYEMLMDEKKHAFFTGGSARISRDARGTFDTHDRYSTGTNLKLVQEAKIVQSWRASDWPLDYFAGLIKIPGCSGEQGHTPSDSPRWGRLKE